MYYFNKHNICNLCQSDQNNHKYLGKRYNRSQGFFFKKKQNDMFTNIYSCKVCKTIFSNPIPLPKEDFKRYENLNTDQMLNFDLDIFNQEILILKKYLYNNKIKFLDVGCGNGYLLNKLNDEGFDTYGLEPVKKFYDLCIKKFPYLKNKIKNTPIEAFNFNNIKFNVISFNSVLEHLINPSEQIKLSLENLLDEGIIHIEVPNSGWLIAKLINFFKFITFQKNVTNLSPMHPPYHYYEFSTESFKLNGKLHGYTIVDHFYRVSEIEFNIPRFLKIILKKIMIKTNSGKQLVVFLKKNKN